MMEDEHIEFDISDHENIEFDIGDHESVVQLPGCSDDAECGGDLDEIVTSEASSTNTKKERNRRIMILTSICLAACVFIAIGMGVGYDKRKKQSEDNVASSNNMMVQNNEIVDTATLSKSAKSSKGWKSSKGGKSDTNNLPHSNDVESVTDTNDSRDDILILSNDEASDVFTLECNKVFVSEEVKYGCDTVTQSGVDATTGNMNPCFCGLLNDKISDDELTTAELTAQNDVTCVDGFAGIYPCNNVDLMSFMPKSVFSSDTLNDIWGWTHSDSESEREFAIVVGYEGTFFVEISNSTSPIYLGTLSSHTVNSNWR